MSDELVASLPVGRVHIGGRWVETERRFDDVDPHTEQAFAQAPDAGEAEMSAALAAAREAADGPWPRMPVEERSGLLRQLAAALEKRADEFAELGTVEWGMTANERPVQIDVAGFQATNAADTMAEALADDPMSKPEWGITSAGMHAPLGVVAAITPWNFPHTINMQKLAPALAAGNSVVLKPSPLTPFAALGLARVVAEDTDIPPGVVNVVTTSSVAVAEMLTADPRVDMVTFVGSAATARSVGASAAGTMKRVLFELGGKSAALYLDDVDVDTLGPQTVLDSCTMHAGQACILYSRLLVHRTIYEPFVERFAELARAVTVGDPSDPASEMGPLIDAGSLERVEAMVDRARNDGARVVTGGRRPAHLDTGHYYEPTVLADVRNEMEIAQEEVFGPVTCIIPFDDDADAVRLANASRYGLVGTVHSPDRARALDLARQIDAGVVTLDGAPPFGAFGGFKHSGIGREGGAIGIRSYTELRSVTYFG